MYLGWVWETLAGFFFQIGIYIIITHDIRSPQGNETYLGGSPLTDKTPIQNQKIILA